jgi:hypothetical protein
MSLSCGECRNVVGPSERLPGREGTLIYTVLQSLVYIPSEEGIRYTLRYVKPGIGGWCLCFACIERQAPAARKERALKPVYDCYEAETLMDRMEEQGGALLHQQWSQAYGMFRKKAEAIPSGCLFCEGKVENGKPYFVSRAIDRVYSEKHLSGLFFGEGNYSLSNVRTGETGFRFCFDDFMRHFPVSFEGLGYELLGERNPKERPGQSELHISREAEAAFERETGKSLDDFLKEGIDADNVKIIREARRGEGSGNVQ